MKYNNFLRNIGRTSFKLMLIISCMLVLTFGWQGRGNNAYAATFNNNSPLLLANMGNSGLENQVKGRVQQDIGKTQSTLDDMNRKAERSAKRVTGNADEVNPKIKERVQQSMENIDTTENRAQKNVRKVGDATENALEKVKDFLIKD